MVEDVQLHGIWTPVSVHLWTFWTPEDRFELLLVLGDGVPLNPPGQRLQRPHRVLVMLRGCPLLQEAAHPLIVIPEHLQSTRHVQLRLSPHLLNHLEQISIEDLVWRQHESQT